MNEVAIKVENVSKHYFLGLKRKSSLRESFEDNLNWLFKRHSHPKEEEFWALKNINFEVKKGEVLGIIGRNGAGKSTLLKVLSRITLPSTGRIEMNGRIASLLEVGTGFHPELTGKENIFMNGAILGMRQSEIRQKFDEIVNFSGVEKFIDTPVKRYSSGMYVRLAFAVAAHLEPEILIIDEVLAVGDAEFQKKCLGKMGEVARDGRTVLFVSHNMAAVESLCTNCLVLDNGEVSFHGLPKDALGFYLKKNHDPNVLLAERTDRIGSGEIKIKDIFLKDHNGNILEAAISGQNLKFQLDFEKNIGFSDSNVIVSIAVKTTFDVPVFLHHNRLTGFKLGKLPETGAFVLNIKKLPLPAGSYKITYSVIQHNQLIDCIPDACELVVEEGDFFGSGEIPPINHGTCLVEGDWEVIS